MVKTRSQTGNIAIKKEEVEDCKPTLDLASASNTTTNKTAERRPSQSNNVVLPSRQVKVEENTDIKTSLKSTSKSLKRTAASKISQEQINQLISAIVDDKMSITEASRKTNMAGSTGSDYYRLYQNDPDKKIPSPRNRFMHSQRSYTQAHIKNLIQYIENGNITIKEASAKADMTYNCGWYYYKKYLKDPNHAIPIPGLYQRCTQEQKDQLISYIVNDKMTVGAASKRAKMGIGASSNYYNKYFKGPNHTSIRKHYTQKQIKELIRYIFNDKMSITDASRKANFSLASGWRYYRQYLKDCQMEIPVVERTKRHTQDQKNEFIRYAVDDKMSITAASKKANIAYSTCRKYYQKYLNGKKF